MLNGHGRSFNEHWAKKLNLDLHVFVGRDKAVKDAMKGVHFKKGTVVYPVDETEYKNLGACRILDLARSYMDMHDLEWEWDGKAPLFCIEAYSEGNKFKVFRTTSQFFALVPPTMPLVTVETETK